MMVNMVLGTFPNMAAVDNKASYSTVRREDMHTLTAAQFSTPKECRDRWGDGSRSQVGNYGNRVAWNRPGSSGMIVWFCVRRPQLVSSFVSFVCFGTRSLPVRGEGKQS